MDTQSTAENIIATEPVHSGRKMSIGLKITLILVETILLLVLAVSVILLALMRGPSVTARNLMVRSLKETSAIGFIADIFLPSETVVEIMADTGTPEISEMDMSLVTIADTSDSANSLEADEWGFVDEDGDGIIIEEVKGSTYSGYMMIVKDPSRVILGCAYKNFGGSAYTVDEYVQMFGAVAGINGGGFMDENGMGDGSVPDSTVVFNGEFYGGGGTKNAFVGIDDNYILHVDCQDSYAIQNAHIQWGCAYGPILVSNGEIVVEYDGSISGLNPRTAIGQRSDGAILMLVIDGRHVVSLGATYLDEAEIMVRYGAVNAANMDGGSSSLMYYNGEYVNNKAFVIGVRDIPDAWLVLPEGVTFTP